MSDTADRKRRERAGLKSLGYVRIETWVTDRVVGLMQEFGERLKLPTSAVAKIVLNSATPLYLQSVNARLTKLIPMIQRLRYFEHYGMHPGCSAPVRIGSLVLDPKEMEKLIHESADLLNQLERYGLDKSAVLALVPHSVTGAPCKGTATPSSSSTQSVPPLGGAEP